VPFARLVCLPLSPRDAYYIEESMSTNTIGFYQSDGDCFPSLTPALEAMFRIIDRYIDWSIEVKAFQDRPYDCNERASLSLFAGGVWQSSANNLVLEEFCSSKGDTKGRDDIWFAIDRTQYYAEAKQSGKCWHTAEKVKPNRIKSCLNLVRKEYSAARANMRSVNHTLGIVFMVPAVMHESLDQAEETLYHYYQMIDLCLREFAIENPELQFLWAKYIRKDLLEEWAFSDERQEDFGCSRPGVDMLICSGRSKD
jgi:hypothetical protein